MQALIEQEVGQFVDANKTIAVNNNEDLGKATVCIKGIKGLMAKVKESFDPIVDQAHKAHKEAIGQRDKYLLPLQAMEKKFKDAILVFTKRLEAEQAKAIAEVNVQLAKEAEAKKQALLQESQNTDNEWDKEVLAEKAQEIKPVVAEVEGKLVGGEGLTIRKTWKAKVIDEKLVPRMYMEINLSLLNSDAKIENIRKEGIPGIVFYEESSASVRS